MSEYGVLDRCYGEGDLELFSGKLDLTVDGWDKCSFVSLRVAAMSLNPRNAFHGGTCNCKAGCKTKRCHCRQKGDFCSSMCHQGRICENCSHDDDEDEVGDDEDIKTLKERGVKKKYKRKGDDRSAKRQRFELADEEVTTVSGEYPIVL